MDSDRYTAGSNEAVVDVPGTADNFTNLANRGDMNKNGTTDEIDWSAMEQEEVQDKQNYSDKLDICLVDIVS